MTFHEKQRVLAWLPVLAVGALMGLADLHQTDGPITAGLLMLLSCIFTIGMRLPWWGIGLSISGFVPMANLFAAVMHWQLTGVAHGVLKIWTPTLATASGSFLALCFGIAGAAIGLGLRGFLFRLTPLD